MINFLFISGIGNGVVTLMVSLLALMYFERYRGIATGLKYLGGMLCSLVSPQILLYLEEIYGYRGAILIIGALYLNIAVTGLLLKEPTWISLAKKSQVMESADSQRGTNKDRVRHYLNMFKSPFFYAIFASSLAVDFTKSVYMTTLVDYGLDKGFTIKEAESVISYGSVGEVGGFLLFPFVADRKYLSRTTLYMLVFIFFGIGISLQTLSNSYAFFIAAAILVRLSAGCIITMKTVLVGDYFGAERLTAFWTIAGAASIPLVLLTPSMIGMYDTNISLTFGGAVLETKSEVLQTFKA